MNLQGSIIEHQNSISQIYRKIEDRFLENSIIRAHWNNMALDISKQITSLKSLPPSFWNQFKKNQDSQFETINNIFDKQSHDIKEDMPLKVCLSLTLQIEETIIINIYAPIIRNLRGNWTKTALDFYIIVKAHVARIVSVIESFSGDSVLTQRAHVLLHKFEKEAQERAISAAPTAKKTPIPHTIHDNKPKENPQKPTKSSSSIAKHAPNSHNRAKPIAKKVEPARKRAQR
jgi:hypothetical protein